MSLDVRDGPFDIVDKCLQLDEVCSHFGSFVKLLCDTQEFEPATSTAQTTMRNAFDVLMQSFPNCHKKIDSRN